MSTYGSGQCADAAPAPGDVMLNDFVAVLWDERELLRRLEFKLSVLSLIVQSGEWRWLADVDRELLATSERLKTTEMLRAATSARVSAAVRLPDEASLGELARRLDEPWQSILLDHDQALRALTVAVDAAAITSERWLLATDGFDYSDLQERFPLLPAPRHDGDSAAQP